MSLALALLMAAGMSIPAPPLDPLAGRIMTVIGSDSMPVVTALCPGFVAVPQTAVSPISVPLSLFLEFPGCAPPATGGTATSDAPAIVQAAVSGNAVILTQTPGAAGSTVVRYFVGGLEAGQINYVVGVPGALP